MREFIYHRTNGWHATTIETIVLIVMLVGIVLLARKFSGTPVGLLFAVVGFVGFVFDSHYYIPGAILIAVICTYVSWIRRGRDGAHFARHWLTLVFDLGLAAGGFLLYELGRIATNDGEDMAFANAKHLIALQDALRLPHESRLQQWVLGHETVLELVNTTYSYLFLSTVIGTLVWLYLNNFRVYRHVRNAMGLATLVSLGVFALYPMAPPRLMAESGLVDSHARVGLRHGYMNQFAAMPSLHIGWLALVGWGLWSAVRRVHGVVLGVLPASVMMVAVVATGNHFWLDGVVGASLCLGAVVLTQPRHARPASWSSHPASAVRLPVEPLTIGTMLAVRARVRNTIWLLGGLLLFTVIGRLVDPVFTPYWGYLAGQIAILALVIVVLEARSSRRALLSPSTYAIISVAMTVDVLGTAGHMYDRADFYDKIVHLMGTAAVTAVIHDLFEHRGWGRRLGHPNALAVVAVVLGIIVGGIWEFYEVFGDVIFATARNGGIADTTHDLLFDSIGAILAAIILTWRLGESGEEVRPLPAEPTGAQSAAPELLQ